jgi:tyrosinase
MMSKPAKYKSSFSVVENRNDDFVALHANSTGGGLKLDGFKGWEEISKNPWELGATMRNGVHGTGAFLPWHRYAIQVWEDALTSECGWTGGQPCRS